MLEMRSTQIESVERQPSNAAVCMVTALLQRGIYIDLKHNMKEYVWLLLHSNMYFTVDSINGKYKHNLANFDRPLIDGLAEAIYKHLSRSLARIENR